MCRICFFLYSKEGCKNIFYLLCQQRAVYGTQYQDKKELCYNCLITKEEKNTTKLMSDALLKGVPRTCSYHGILNCVCYGTLLSCGTSGCPNLYHEWCNRISKILHPESGWSRRPLCGMCFTSEFIEPKIISALNLNFRKLMNNKFVQPLSLRLNSHSVPYRITKMKNYSTGQDGDVTYIKATMISYNVQGVMINKTTTQRSIQNELEAERDSDDVTSPKMVKKQRRVRKKQQRKRRKMQRKRKVKVSNTNNQIKTMMQLKK